jgi:hypothetical protein
MSRLGFAAFAAATLATVAAPASADPSATVNGGFASVKSDSQSVDSWNVAGAVLAPLGGSGMNLQVDGAYNSLAGSGINGQVTNLSATAFAAGGPGRVGATVGDNLFHGLGIADRTNFGGFGEFWVSPQVTLAAKGGGVSGGGVTAYYAGGEAVFYPAANIAFSGSVDYLHQTDAHVTVSTAQLEWLPGRRWPASIYGGYSSVDFDGVHQDLWMIGLRFQFGAGAGTSLVERQRAGPAQWAAAATTLKF